MSEQSLPQNPSGISGKFILPVLLVCAVCLGQAFAWQIILSEKSLALNFCSFPMWESFLRFTQAQLIEVEAGQTIVEIPLFPLILCPIATFLGSSLIAAWISGNQQQNATFSSRWIHSLWRMIPWGLIPLLWFCSYIITFMLNWMFIGKILYLIPQFVMGLSYAGIFYGLLTAGYERSHRLDNAGANESTGGSWKVLIPVCIYTLIYTAMNWGLYFNLRIPHGDSAMYEEHLFNLLHGKGFRSYLDQGLFLGEHIQVIHALLIPVYIFWQSLLTLEFLQSLCLALSAVPVYRMTRKVTGSGTAGLFMAAAILCYYPLQFLDISVDLKTFRPTAFCIPALLFALEAMENKQYRWMSFWLIITLTGQEDLTLIIGPIALWLVIHRLWAVYQSDRSHWLQSAWRDPGFRYGLFWMIMSPVYLLLALKAIHWFRDGVEIHYAGYFSKFGKSMSEVIYTMVTRPGFLLSELSTSSTFTYFLGLVLPLGFLAIRSPCRLLTGAILFITLCLNELNEGKARAPHYHFHAPIIPVIFWSTVMGLRMSPGEQGRNICSRCCGLLARIFFPNGETARPQGQVYLGMFAFSCALGSGLFYTLSPLGVPFWDAGSDWYYRKLYIPDKRAQMFARLPEIPTTSRIATTDFIHPRFTHYARSYDYSLYKRKQSDYEDKVPDDTDYIIIDTAHPYSTIKKLEDMREWKSDREHWEALPDSTDGYYIVLKRR